MRRVSRIGWFVGALVLLGLAADASASTQSEIAAATGAGKPVFLVVTQANARGTERAMQIAQQAQGMAPEAAVVVLDRGDEENQELVKRYGLLAAPVPLILVIASNGVVAGGALLRNATPEALVRTIPTPKKAEMLLHLSQKLPVFVVVSNKTMVEPRSAVYQACTEAVRRLEGKAATVVVDMDDKAEQAWLKELNIGEREALPVTIVYNAKAQKTKVFRKVMTADELVQAVRAKVSCCPGGSC